MAATALPAPPPALWHLDLSGRRIKLPKIGWVRFRGGREYEGKIKRVTVRMNCAGIYTATALIESEADYPCTPTVDLQPLGIDVGCKTEGERHQFATLSSGEIIHSPALIKRNAKPPGSAATAAGQKTKGLGQPRQAEGAHRQIALAHKEPAQ
jgi:putative transposase